ncbi:MAG: folate family ECF transporter S component [bacterium]|nr:folate family ECF transporter S component [bacterium]
MKKLATLFVDSYKELNNGTVTLTVMGMLAAISVVLGYFSIELTSYIKIGFSPVANQLVYYLFGPTLGACYGFFIDMLKYFIKPTGSWFPGFTLNAMLGGVIYGVLLYKKPISLPRILIAKLVVVVFINCLLNTLWLSMLYGKAFMVLLPARAVKNLVMWPIDSLLFWMVARVVERSGILKMLRANPRRSSLKSK